ncbi:PD-(D/E)XK nuclease family protein [uncultured Campylobacter sp.]|uniref:PDDEXK-like family protein n=1 Tax=uncultured Campylobacter sp. TaxID=218934 RepID=UPI00262DD83B|nr:PD-(D/E)XK nuclease family protein [uncultured Campylobacter sp.]
MSKNDLEILKEFINDKEAQEKFNAIKNSVMDFNIFEIAGLGNQEIKHSNTLAWLFGDNEHGLKYQILEGFLKFTLENSDNTSEGYKNLEKYLKIQEKNIRVFRESDNIDLLLIDENNKLVITIENKVEADEGEEQLLKYRKFIDDKYNDFERIYIFLTKDGRLPADETERGWWLIATYKMVSKNIESLLNKNQTISEKAKIILLSYVDLLKGENIVEDDILQAICDDVWNNPKYKRVLEILISHRETNIDILYRLIINKLEECGIRKYNTDVFDIKTNGTDLIAKKIFEKSWAEVSSKVISIIIEKQLRKHHKVLRISYYHHSIKEDKVIKIQSKIRENLKIDNSTQFTYICEPIKEDSLENFTENQLQSKAEELVGIIKEQINIFNNIVKSELGIS